MLLPLVVVSPPPQKLCHHLDRSRAALPRGNGETRIRCCLPFIPEPPPPGCPIHRGTLRWVGMNTVTQPAFASIAHPHTKQQQPGTSPRNPKLNPPPQTPPSRPTKKSSEPTGKVASLREPAPKPQLGLRTSPILEVKTAHGTSRRDPRTRRWKEHAAAKAIPATIINTTG